jgi:serine/threonine protein kinase
MAGRVGQQLGHYRLVRLLGQGGFAEVYLGEHLYLGTEAAIKLLHTQLAGEDTDAFRKEARTIARLVHPHIVRVFDFGIEGGTPYLVMDYAPGGTLRQRHPRGTRLPLTTILSYVKQVTEALQHAHEEKFIHRDVKPENMLVGRRDAVLLSDFGIALIAQSSRYQSTQEVVGTVAYMSPEQIQGKPRPQSDQYSLSIVVYEWLSGDRPFRGSFTELCTQHMFATPAPLREKVPTISTAVEQVVMTALSKDPHQRFATIQAFASALEQASQIETSTTLPASGSSPMIDARPKLPPTQHPTELATAPGESALPTQLSTLSNQTGDPTESDKPTTQASVSPTQVATPASSRHVPTEMAHPSRLPATAPGKSFPQPPPQRGISRRTVVLGLAGLTVVGGASGLFWLIHSQQPLAPFTTKSTPGATSSTSPLSVGTTLYSYRGHASIVTTVGWSPDGKRIASGGQDGTVQVWDASNGGNVYTYRGNGGYVTSVSWSHDSKRIASGSANNTVQVWDAVNGEQVYIHRQQTNDYYDEVYAVAWSPDGKRIASGGGFSGIDATVEVWDAVNGDHVFIYRGHSSQVTSVSWSPDGKRIASASDTKVQVWDASTGGHVFIYRGHSEAVTALAWSPSGKRIASGSDTVQVWDAIDGGHIFTYQSSAAALAWSPSGKRIASASGYTVQVWDAADGGNVYTYTGHSDAVNTVAWSPDGTRIASGSNDHTVQVWQAS